MKKLLLIATILFTMIEMASITGCTDPLVVTPTITSRLIGKWTIQTAESNTIINGTSDKQSTPYTASDYFEFKTGGAVTIVESGVTQTGTWKVTNDRVFFTGTSMDNTTGWAVPVLTASKLQLFNSSFNSTITTELTLNLIK